jgi:amino acid adenylation domain-containing protein
LPDTPDLNTQQSQEAFWEDRLGGELPVLQIWSDHPRPPISSFVRQTETIELDTAVVAQIRGFCERENLPLFVMLLAAFKSLLHRYTAIDDIIVVTPSCHRRDRSDGTEEHLTNLLALRSSLANDPSFDSLLKQVARVVDDAAANREYSYGKLLDKLAASKANHPTASEHAPFRVMFTVCDRALPGTASAPITEDTLLAVEEHTNRSDLFLVIREQDRLLTVTCQYDAEIFEHTTIIRMLGHYRTLLEDAAARPALSISELRLLPQSEERELLFDWNATKKQFPKDQCVHELFEHQAEKSPDAPALMFEGQEITYAELNYRSNRLAHYLKRFGVGAGVLVGLYVERSLEMVIGLLGVLKAGAAYVPLDPSYPSERLRFVIQDAGLRLVLSQRQLAQAMPAHDAEVICLDSDQEKIGRENPENPTRAAAPTDRAYVIYTSGSTGNPKGVQINHASVTNFLASMAEQPGLTAKDVMLAVTTISFDIAALEIFLPLTLGARVVIVPREVAIDGFRLMRCLDQSRASVMQATPATWCMLLEAGWRAVPGFKILCGGEAMPAELAKKLIEQGELWNLYGPTETTIWSTVGRVTSAEALVPIGRPIANTEIYILDGHLRPLPIGVAGELHIGGAGVARGYLERPDLTAQKFITHPFAQDPTARLYKTGDLARYLPDKSIEYLERLDHQVKIRGFRIELGEIESVLLRDSRVARSVAVVREDAPGQKKLVVYVVPTSGTKVSPQELKALLKDRLPEYMIPSRFVVLDALPATPNGKIDRRALPAPDPDEAELPDVFRAPRGATDQLVAAIWANVLGTERVGIEDNFFDLGGHSFLLGRVQLQLKDQLGREVSLVDLYRYPTIRALSDFLNQAAREGDRSSDPRAQRQRSALERLRQMRPSANRAVER